MTTDQRRIDQRGALQVRDYEVRLTVAAESAAHLKRVEQALEDLLSDMGEALSERFSSYQRSWSVQASRLLRVIEADG